MDTAIDTVFISPIELNARLGRADAPLVLDVRRDAKFAGSRRRVVGALRCAPQDIAALATSQPPREVVVHCVYGHQVSAEAAATLRAAGWDARVLAGGIEGGEDGVDTPADLHRWRAAPVLTLAQRPDLGVTGEQPSLWITRERPKIDRVACPWLVRRFIDPRARFLYRPASRVLDEAQRLGAVAYDLPGAPITHQGELCSFDALLAAFDLHDATLHRLATIVRGADTDRLQLAPQSAGLLALSLGLSHNHRDDTAMMEAAMPLYDALYAWCRGALAETHRWNLETLTGAAA